MKKIWQVTQQKHIISTAKQDKVLFGSGVEKTIPYILGDDFVNNAKKDGVVESINSEEELAVLKYNDGSKEVIDLSTNLAKNSNGGFFTTNKKSMVVKEGEKFKVNDIIAKNDGYFLGDTKDTISYSTGKLCKIAIASADYTYEDSSIVTNKLTTDMSSKISMKKDIVLGPNTNIEYLVKKGDMIKTGESLVVFENSFEDQSINDLLDKIGTDFKESIKDLSKNILKSKYTGEIVAVNIYYNRDIEEFSPSIQNIIKEYNAKGNAKKKLINSINTEGFSDIELPSTEKQPPGKIKGTEVDGILIEIYIEYVDDLGVGDKITYYTALKTIISDIIKEGEEPFSTYRESEDIDAIVSPLSIVSRMTLDIYSALFLNKLLIEMKNQVKDIFYS